MHSAYTKSSMHAPAANAMDRKFIDLGSEMVRELTDVRPFYSHNESMNPHTHITLGPSKVDQRNLTLPFSKSGKPYPEVSITTRHCHTSVTKPRGPVNVVKWTPDGRRLVSGASSGDLNIWSGLGFSNERTITGHRSAVRALEWTKSGDWLISGDNDGGIKVFNPQYRPLVDKDTAHSASVRGLSFSPTDTKFASCSDDLAVKVWDFDSGCTEERKLSGHGFDVKSVDWHPYKALILSGGRDNLVKLWDPRSSNNNGEILTVSGHKKSVNVVKWNPHNGNWFLTASRDRSVRIYDIRMVVANFKANNHTSTESGDRCLHVLTAHSSEVYAAAWHPVHENMLATGGWDGSLLFWIVHPRAGGADHTTPSTESYMTSTLHNTGDLSKAEEPMLQASVPAAHENAIWSMDWHPSGHMLCTGSNDTTCKFWSRMRPGATVDHFYGGFQRDITEIDVLKELGLAPPAPPIESKRTNLNSNRDDLATDSALENMNQARQLFGTQSIPGIGVIDNEFADQQVGMTLFPPSESVANQQGADMDEAGDLSAGMFTTDIIDTMEREKMGSEYAGRQSGPDDGSGPGGPRGARGSNSMQSGGRSNMATNRRPPADLTQLRGTRVGGLVKHWDERGFGFIKPDIAGMADCFARATDVLDGYGHAGESRLAKGDRVVFRFEEGENINTGARQDKAREIILQEFHEGPLATSIPGVSPPQGGMNPGGMGRPPPPQGMAPPQLPPQLAPPRGMMGGPQHFNRPPGMPPGPPPNMPPGGPPPLAGNSNNPQQQAQLLQLLHSLQARNASQADIMNTMRQLGITPDQLQGLLAASRQAPPGQFTGGPGPYPPRPGNNW